MGTLAVVTGSRVWTDYPALTRTLEQVDPAYVLHGQARGADLLASQWCQSTGVPVIEVPALWRSKGRAAGFLRNALLIEMAIGLGRVFNVEPVVVAFPKPASKGTIDMINRADRNCLRVVVCMAAFPTNASLSDRRMQP